MHILQLLSRFTAMYRAKILRNLFKPKDLLCLVCKLKTWSHTAAVAAVAVAAAAAAIPEVRFWTTKSSWPKSTERRQCTDSLAQAGLDGSDLHLLTDVHRQALHCTDALLQKEEAGRMYGESQTGGAGGSADIQEMTDAHCFCGHVGQHGNFFLLSLLFYYCPHII